MYSRWILHSYQIIGHIIYILARIRTVGMSENPGGANICHVVLQINHSVKGWLLLIRHAGKNALTKLRSFKKSLVRL